MIHYPLPHSDDNQPLTIAVEDRAAKAIYASAATWYGEESPLELLKTD